MARSSEEEVVNAVTHFVACVGVLLSALLVLSMSPINKSVLIPAVVMCGCSIWAFFTSYLYHASPIQTVTRERNRIVDKTGIYVMITGCGCAFSMITPDIVFGTLYCVFIFCLSGYFILRLCSQKGMSETYSVASYVVLSWLAFTPATGILSPTPIASGDSFTLAILGIVSYALGVVFYVSDRRKWHHTIWHILAVAGFAFHFSSLVCL